MALFKNLFKGKSTAKHKGYSAVQIKSIDRLTSDAVKVTLDLENTSFLPGQYLNFIIELNGEELRRSYSICSGKDEPIAVAVKEVENGTVSKWFNRDAKPGMEILVSDPTGNFTLAENVNNILAVAAGSGITPILSIAKACEDKGTNLRLFYGNRNIPSTLFKEEIDALKNTTCTYFFTGGTVEGQEKGRIDKDAFTALIKADLSLLRFDGYYLCGPEELIINCKEVLEMFGVSKDKIHFELFTTPVAMKSESTTVEEAQFDGNAKVTIILDDDTETFELASNGKAILDKAKDEGIDVPYSCMGGVCSTCKAKVLKGKAKMDMNYSLTDREVEEGYILTCQAHPITEEIIVSYDE